METKNLTVYDISSISQHKITGWRQNALCVNSCTLAKAYLAKNRNIGLAKFTCALAEMLRETQTVNPTDLLDHSEALVEPTLFQFKNNEEIERTTQEHKTYAKKAIKSLLLERENTYDSQFEENSESVHYGSELSMRCESILDDKAIVLTRKSSSILLLSLIHI